jgi:hypothetical protein
MADKRNLFEKEVRLGPIKETFWLRGKVRADKRNLFD